MQILTFAEQFLTKPTLFGLEWGNEANGDFLRTLLSVRVALNLAVAERVGATITKKKNYFLLGATEEVVATIIVGGNFFLLGA